MVKKINHSKSNKKIETKTGLCITVKKLSEFALKIDDNSSALLSHLQSNPEMICSRMKRKIKNILKGKKAQVKINEIIFLHVDSDNISHRLAFFEVKLSGEVKELNEIMNGYGFFPCDLKTETSND